ncbi:hypothetical protein H2200_000418 [Cladophialophora chaetospira]|uniref:Uncharacterized protein n=1 Tax=Cladophialophora chaetospira TaxID=386627 RepID=A0AA38XNH6_9EURO|nr:hypothetical protein H2200_000418 [Cladophialophora chaetospira]
MDTVNSSSVTAEPAQTVTTGVSQIESKTESATPQKIDNVNPATTPQSSTTEVASPETNGIPSNNKSHHASKGPRPPPKFDAATEDRVRELMSKARRVANGGNNAFKTDEDVYDLALLTNNLVQLMNAAYIATDTIVRGVSYMQGESHAHAKTAMSRARQDRRDQKAAEEALNDTANQAPAQADAKEPTPTSGDSKHTEVATSPDSNKENAAPVTADEQHNGGSLQNKNSKKKRNWNNRRTYNKRKTSADHKAQENKVDGPADDVAEAKDNAGGKEAVNEDKPEMSGTETTAEKTVAGQDVVVAVKA